MIFLSFGVARQHKTAHDDLIALLLLDLQAESINTTYKR